ncbi:acetoin dehydrogenase dihydrolipoyllysine-residue acetyltransferase subunit [Ensifer soli]|uniref:acetoin dehydrogenase dihydrolipoyllysine-residue acetyltransferase subunit n=1 Tax=Ciceribacter sp. sgz301302 TaxID=3342379 RepID=UPI0035B952F4
MTERTLKMPRLGETMDEGRIVGWLIRPGDAFKRGDPILEIETDKTIAEFPALGEGVLGDILVEIGDMIAVGTPIARIDIGTGPDWTAEDTVPVSAPLTATGIVETDLAMPRLGETMDEGRVARWLKGPGDAFKRGEAILEIETDKTIAEFPALMDGTLVSITRGDGEMVTVGDPIARIAISSADLAAAGTDPATTAAAEAVATVAAAEAPVAKPAVALRAPSSGPVRATPLARRIARRHGIDIRTIAGTGWRGRVEKSDVEASAFGSATSPAPRDVLFASLAAGRLAYLDTGKGEKGTVVLLHGFSGDRTTWAALASSLKRADYRVLVPDLPGHGLTTIEAASASDLAASLPAFLDQVAPGETVRLVGHSLGSVAALDLALSAKGRVSDVTLLAPAGLGHEIDTGFVHGMAEADSAGEVAHLLRRLSPNRLDLSEAALVALAADLAKGRLKALAAALAGPAGQKVDSLTRLERLAGLLPVRIVFGLEDRIIPWQQVTAVPPRVAIHLLARSGHMPQWDQTKDVLDILLS